MKTEIGKHVLIQNIDNRKSLNCFLIDTNYYLHTKFVTLYNISLQTSDALHHRYVLLETSILVDAVVFITSIGVLA